MHLTSFEVTMGLLGICLSIVACAAVFGVFMVAERNRFERYERLRGILQDICNPQGAHAIKLLAVHELRNYREYAGVIARAFEKPAEPQGFPGKAPAAPRATKLQPQAPKAMRVQAAAVIPQLVRKPASQPLAMQPVAPFPAAQVANDRARPAHLAVVETPKRDILDGVIIRERGLPVKTSVLREFLRFRDAVTDRLIHRSH